MQQPGLGFVEMAAGMGVAGSQATTPDEVSDAVARALATPGPYLIDIVIAGK
ncbi:MAG: thiamine pyrophosphate-dependent enzyme [Gammaproteobacteria bacterium]